MPQRVSQILRTDWKATAALRRRCCSALTATLACPCKTVESLSDRRFCRSDDRARSGRSRAVFLGAATSARLGTTNTQLALAGQATHNRSTHTWHGPGVFAPAHSRACIPVSSPAIPFTRAHTGTPPRPRPRRRASSPPLRHGRPRRRRRDPVPLRPAVLRASADAAPAALSPRRAPPRRGNAAARAAARALRAARAGPAAVGPTYAAAHHKRPPAPLSVFPGPALRAACLFHLTSHPDTSRASRAGVGAGVGAHIAGGRPRAGLHRRLGAAGPWAGSFACDNARACPRRGRRRATAGGGDGPRARAAFAPLPCVCAKCGRPASGLCCLRAAGLASVQEGGVCALLCAPRPRHCRRPGRSGLALLALPRGLPTRAVAMFHLCSCEPPAYRQDQDRKGRCCKSVGRECRRRPWRSGCPSISPSGWYRPTHRTLWICGHFPHDGVPCVKFLKLIPVQGEAVFSSLKLRSAAIHQSHNTVTFSTPCPLRFQFSLGWALKRAVLAATHSNPPTRFRLSSCWIYLVIHFDVITQCFCDVFG